MLSSLTLINEYYHFHFNIFFDKNCLFHFLVGTILSCLSRNLPSVVVVQTNNTIYGQTLYAKQTLTLKFCPWSGFDIFALVDNN